MKYFKTFQVYSSCIYFNLLVHLKLYFKTFQVYSSFTTGQEEGLSHKFQNFSSL